MTKGKILIPVLLSLVVLALAQSSAWAYGYCGYEWGSGYANYYIGTSCPTNWRTPIQSSATTWNNAGACFDFYYRGTTSRGKARDYYNVVARYNRGNNGALAVTTIWRSSSTRISECDMEYNSYYSWSVSGAAGYYDVQNVGTHEFGHFLCLRDLYNSSARDYTMYGYVSTGETKKRTLHTDDINGIRYIYGTCLDAMTPPDGGQ